jgi:hypothetical protein
MYTEAQNTRQKGTKDDKSISSVVSLSVQPSGQPCVNRLRLIAIEENATFSPSGNDRHCPRPSPLTLRRANACSGHASHFSPPCPTWPWRRRITAALAAQRWASRILSLHSHQASGVRTRSRILLRELVQYRSVGVMRSFRIAPRGWSAFRASILPCFA